MFARNVSVRLKTNSSVAFTKMIEDHTIPTLRKHPGFAGIVTLLGPGETEAVAISFWDNKESAAAYANSGYSEVMKNLNKFIEGTPQVKAYEVVNSTLHHTAAAVGV
jgi:heme-degrading monooxygenase HmoA